MNNQEYLTNIKQQFTLADIKKVINSLSTKKVLVIGDTIIDEYCFVEPKGRAMKDPILSVDYVKEESYAGGILAIANHVSNFARKVKVVTLLGENLEHQDMIRKKLNPNIEVEFFEKKGAPTTRKKRYISQTRNEKLFKIEYINDAAISQELEQQLLLFLGQELPRYEVVVVGDFGHGFINENLIRLLESKASFLAVNAQTNSANFGFNYATKYQVPSFISLDGTELTHAVGERSDDYPALIKKLHAKKGFKRILLTMGRNGIIYFNDDAFTTSPSLVSKVTDIVGAGDAVFAVTSLLAAEKVPDELLAFIANCVGGIKVNIMGNKESISPEMLINFIEAGYKTVEEQEVSSYFDTVNNTLNNLNKSDISAFVQMLLETYRDDKTIYVFGNGGSSATASHFCGDLVKGVSYGLEKRFRAICLNDNLPALMAIANDISYDDIFVEQLKNFLREGDLVIGISGSGNSLNVVKALEYARGKGAKTVAICGYAGGKIKEIADLSVHAEVQDMEVSEDIHNLVMVHCVKQMLTKELKNNKVGEEYAKRVAL